MKYRRFLKKQRNWLLLFGLLFSACDEEQPLQKEVLEKKTDISVFAKGLGHIESIAYDGTYFYLSSFGAQLTPGKKDGNGKLVKLDAEGQVVADNVAADAYLSAPKGTLVVAGKIFVNDIDSVKVIDLATGTLLKEECIDFRREVKTVATLKEGDEIKVQGTEAHPGLNDMAKGTDDNIFISVTNTGNIFRYNISKKKLQKIANVPYANGLAYRDGALYVNGFTTGHTLTKIVQADVTNGAVKNQSLLEGVFEAEGGLDGLAVRGQQLIFSDWGKDYFSREAGVLAVGTLYTYDLQTHTITPLIFEGMPQKFKGPADVLLVGDSTLYVPALGEQTVYKITLK